MKPEIHFVCGLPRAGSTLLCNLLNQNPRFKAAGTSPLCLVLGALRDVFWNFSETRAIPDEDEVRQKIRNFQTGALQNYYQDTEQAVVFDKNRQWLQNAEIAEHALGRRPKFIVCVRDIRTILASLELLWRKTKDYRVITQEQGHRGEYQTIDGRCRVLLMVTQMVGAPFQAIKDAVTRGYREDMLFVEYEKLCDRPGAEMQAIYDFIGETKFKHDFEKVAQTIRENDTPYQWGELHNIREGEIIMSETDWKKVLPVKLGAALEEDARFWTRL